MDDQTKELKRIADELKLLVDLHGKLANKVTPLLLERKMTTPERRADVGSKVTVSVLLGTVGILLGMFFNSVYGMAKDSVDLSTTNRVDIAVLQQTLASLDKTLCSMNEKMDMVITHVNRDVK